MSLPTEGSAARGAAAGHAAQAAQAALREERSCGFCGMSLAGRSPRARWCSNRCQLAGLRREKRIEARRKRPRCLICMDPLPYWKRSFTNRATTCSRACAIKRWNWFGRVATNERAAT